MENYELKFRKLMEIVARLRSENGCPWDKKQTPQTLKSYLLEETHEAFEAIAGDNPDHIREELGDLQFIIVFLAQLYEDKELFSMDDILSGIIEKMIRRHPHVFANASMDTEKELRKRWLAIKEAENRSSSKTTSMEYDRFQSVPMSLPALRRAQRILEKAAYSGFDWPDMASVISKIDEEIAELKAAVAKGDTIGTEEELGDVLLALANLGRKIHIDPEAALAAAIEKFINRFRQMEIKIINSGKTINGLDGTSLHAVWQSTKND